MHRVGDVDELARQLTMLHQDQGLLERLRTTGLSMAPEITWTAAGVNLLDAYRQTIAQYKADAAAQIRGVERAVSAIS